MLFEDCRRGQCRLETVRFAMPDNAAETAQRLAARFMVIGQRIQPSLDGNRRAKAIDDPLFGRREPQSRRWNRFSAWEREPL